MLFFFFALVYGGYCYIFVFTETRSGPLNSGAIATNVALFSIFALHHSVFARDAIRNSITRIVGTLERSFYVWVASFLFIAVCALWRPVAGLAWYVEQASISSLMRVAQLAGVGLTLWSAWLIDIAKLSGVTQVRDSRAPSPDTSEPEFTRRGPYGWVRHPIYSGWFLMVFSEPVMTMTRFAFACISSLYLVLAIPFEERSLRRVSKGAYDQYTRDVRWKIVPGVF